MGGQSGDVVQIKKMWLATVDKATGGATYTEIQSTVVDNVTIYDISKGVNDIAYYATDDENTPDDINGENIALVCQALQKTVIYGKNIGAHQQGNTEQSNAIAINVFGDIDITEDSDTPPQPYMSITIDYGR